MPQTLNMSDLLGSGAILSSLDAPAKKGLLQLLAAHAASLTGLEEHVVFDILWEREKLGTTGVGGGIAIPHGRVPGLTQVRGFFARLAQPVGFDAVDGKPVDLVFLLLAPEEAGADHLHALAAVSRVLRDPAFCEKLRATPSEDGLKTLLNQAEIQGAA